MEISFRGLIYLILLFQSVKIFGCECDTIDYGKNHVEYYYHDHIFAGRILSIENIVDNHSLVRIENIERFKGGQIDSFVVDNGSSCSLFFQIGESWLIYMKYGTISYCGPSLKYSPRSPMIEAQFEFLRDPEQFENYAISSDYVITEKVKLDAIVGLLNTHKCESVSREGNKVFFEAISTFDGRIKSIKVLDKYSNMDISSLDCILKEIKMIRNLEPAKIDNHPVNSRIVFSLPL